MTQSMKHLLYLRARQAGVLKIKSVVGIPVPIVHVPAGIRRTLIGSEGLARESDR
jgi:hypothetical protein